MSRFFVPLFATNERRELVTPRSLCFCVWPSDHSVSNHHAAPQIALTRYPSASAASCGPAIGSAESLASLRSGLRQLTAGSPASQAESSSQSLRTGRSLPVALHLLSQGRSYLPFQAGERMPGEDLHLSDQTQQQTYCHVHLAHVGPPVTRPPPMIRSESVFWQDVAPGD